MTISLEVTEKMIQAAMKVGRTSGALVENARHCDIRRMIASAVGAAAIVSKGPKYDLWVNITVDMKKARFLGASQQRGYFRIETEDGKEYVVHANDIQPSRQGK